MKAKFDVTKHILVPKHSKLSEKDTKALLERFHVTLLELPKISIKDPAIQDLSPKVDEIIKIERESRTAGATIFYRCVINA